MTTFCRCDDETKRETRTETRVRTKTRAMRAASCAPRVSAPHTSRRASLGSRFGPGRPRGVDPSARVPGRGSVSATAPAAPTIADDPAVAALVAWAVADGLVLSPKVAVGAPSPGAPRGLVATDDVEEGETVLFLPTSCTAFDASAARADTALGLGAAIRDYESASRTRRGADVSDEVALALYVAFAARHPEKTSFGAYAAALPKDKPESILFLDDETFREILPSAPLSLVDAAEDARVDLFLAWDVAAEVADRMTANAAANADAPAQPLTVDEFTWAWASVRSRAIAFRFAERPGDLAAAAAGGSGGDGGGGGGKSPSSRRCMVPVVDMMNHACEACAGDLTGASHFPGPAVRAEARADGVAWRATRALRRRDELTWTYGPDASNEHLWVHYGFVPAYPAHRGTSVTFTVRASVLCEGIAAVAKEDDPETSAKRFGLLSRLGVAAPGAATADGAEKEYDLRFRVEAFSKPVSVAGVAGIACCSASEVHAMCASLETRREGSAGISSPIALCPESRRRAGRYAAFILARVEPAAVGAAVAGIAAAGSRPDGSSSGAARRNAFAMATRAREGAVATFRSFDAILRNESLLEDGSWIDEAVRVSLAGARE